MSFASYSFLLLFLPVLLVVWHLAGLVRREWLGGVLLAASLVFLAFQDIRAPFLLLALVVVNYGAGLVLAAPGDGPSSLSRRAVLALGVLVNILPLALLRGGVLAGLFPEFLPSASGFTLATPVACGLAFWMLVQIAWLAGIYRREIEPEGLARHALFSSLLPCLVAGPVLRYEQVARQLDGLGRTPEEAAEAALPGEEGDEPLPGAQGTCGAEDMAVGLSRLVLGLAKKLFLADTLGIYAAAAFAAADGQSPLTWLEAWGGVFCFSLQIYFDFSGYTDMALGIGRLFGLRLPENFHAPYRATGFIEFWRRWHVTLSSWLRDCVYVPLGGEWEGALRSLAGFVATLLVVALWHGFAAGFLVWGALHGLFLFANHLFRELSEGSALQSLFATIPLRILCTALTFVLVSLCWIPFRASSLDGALSMGRALVGGLAAPAAPAAGLPGAADAVAAHAPGLLANGIFASPLSLLPLVLGLVVVFALPCVRDVLEGSEDGSRCRIAWACTRPWALALALLAFACLVVLGSARPFLF